MLTVIPNTAAVEPFRNGRDGVCLFSYEEDGKGHATLTVIPTLADTLRAYFATEKAPLSPTALCALNAKLHPYLSAHGYVPDSGNGNVYRVFCADPTDFSPKTPNLSTNLMELGDNYQNLTTIDLPAALREGCVAYGYIEDGRILSLAITHAAPKDGKVELTLETARGYRSRGYGKAALGALCAHLLTRGVSVIYRTRENNVPSARAALSVGLRAAGLSYRYLGRRK